MPCAQRPAGNRRTATTARPAARVRRLASPDRKRGLPPTAASPATRTPPGIRLCRPRSAPAGVTPPSPETAIVTNDEQYSTSNPPLRSFAAVRAGCSGACGGRPRRARSTSTGTAAPSPRTDRPDAATACTARNDPLVVLNVLEHVERADDVEPVPERHLGGVELDEIDVRKPRPRVAESVEVDLGAGQPQVGDMPASSAITPPMPQPISSIASWRDRSVNRSTTWRRIRLRDRHQKLLASTSAVTSKPSLG